jgi:hypothetical protein
METRCVGAESHRLVEQSHAARSPRSTLVPSTALALATVALAALALAAPALAGGKPRALILKDAQSPVLTALKRDHLMRFQRSDEVSRTGPRRYDMLVVDGDNLSPRKMARRKEVRRFTRAHRWVLGLDLRAGHGRVISKHTGFQASPRGVKHTSDSFLYTRAMVGNEQRTVMVEAPRLMPRGSSRLGKNERARLRRSQARELAALIDDRVTSGAQALGAQLPGAQPGENSPIPPELQHVGWTKSVVGSAAPKAGYWTAGKGDSGLIFYPAPGTQTASWTLNYNFDIYLDNDPSRPANQHHQIVTYDLNGQVTPKKVNESFFHMSDNFRVAANDGYHLERAWWTGAVGVDVQPDPPTDAKLVWQASEPQTPNADHEYTSGQDFTVGFTGSKEGAEVHADYGVHNEVSNSIPDWGVENQTSQNHLRWRFSARAPCDPRPDHYAVDQCFDSAAFTYLGPHQPNDLSTGQLQVLASGRWNTRAVLDGEAAKLGLDLDTPITLVDTYCEDFEFFVCPVHSRLIDRTTVGPPKSAVTLDTSQVVPVGIESLDLQHTADGSKNEKVQGTVALEKKAPRDTDVIIYSDSVNASVGGPSGRGSQRTITIGEGSTAADFQVATNDNGLNPGGHVTANITAFYGDATTEQLRICAGAPPC